MDSFEGLSTDRFDDKAVTDVRSESAERRNL